MVTKHSNIYQGQRKGGLYQGNNLSIGIKVDVPAKVWCDNMATIRVDKNPIHHNRTKHVEINWHFIKEKINSGLVEFSYVPMNSQVVDVFAKSLPRVRFEK